MAGTTPTPKNYAEWYQALPSPLADVDLFAFFRPSLTPQPAELRASVCDSTHQKLAFLGVDNSNHVYLIHRFHILPRTIGVTSVHAGKGFSTEGDLLPSGFTATVQPDDSWLDQANGGQPIRVATFSALREKIARNADKDWLDGPHDATAEDTEEVQVRKTCVLPPRFTARALVLLAINRNMTSRDFAKNLTADLVADGLPPKTEPLQHFVQAMLTKSTTSRGEERVAVQTPRPQPVVLDTHLDTDRARLLDGDLPLVGAILDTTAYRQALGRFISVFCAVFFPTIFINRDNWFAMSVCFALFLFSILMGGMVLNAHLPEPARDQMTVSRYSKEVFTARGNTTSTQHQHYHTTHIDGAGREVQIGPLRHDRVPHPRDEYPMRSQPFFFFCHTGQDGIKELFGWPTRWFLEQVVGDNVTVFLDDGGAEVGRLTMLELLEKAHQCTHGLALLSPTFRHRVTAVMELNTFSDRSLKDPNFNFIPVLWLIPDATGYGESVDGRIYSRSRYLDPAAFLIRQLWPLLVRSLGRPALTEDRLRRALLEYIETHRGRVIIPVDLENFHVRNSVVPVVTSNMAVVVDPPADLHGAKVFLSHTFAATNSAAFSSAIYARLRDIGVNCFLDRETIAAGKDWRASIETSATTCSLFVCIVTPPYFYRHWCMKELDLALSHGRPILPIWLDWHHASVSWNEFYDVHVRGDRPVPLATVERWLDNVHRVLQIQAIRVQGTDDLDLTVQEILRLLRD